MNPMIGGQAMLPTATSWKTSPPRPNTPSCVADMKDSGIAGALKGEGQFTVFAPTNAALDRAWPPDQNKAQLARMMAYLVVPGSYDSQSAAARDRRRRRPGQIAHRRRRRAGGADEWAHEM